MNKDCPFLSSTSLKTAKWADKTLPQLKKDDNMKEILPFYYTYNQGDTLLMNVTLGTKTDVCIDLGYSMAGKTTLSVSYESNNPFKLDHNEMSPSKLEKQEICASHLSNNVQKKFQLKLKSDGVVNGSIYLKLDKQDGFEFEKDAVPEMPYLIDWEDTNDKDFNQFVNQWNFFYPDNEWSRDKSSKTIKFSGINQQFEMILESIFFSQLSW